MSTSHFRPDTLRYGGMLVIRHRQCSQSVTKHHTGLARANQPAGIQQPAQMWQISLAGAGRHARNRCWRFPGGHDFIEKGRSWALCLEAMTSSSSSARVAEYHAGQAKISINRQIQGSNRHCSAGRNGHAGGLCESSGRRAMHATVCC